MTIQRIAVVVVMAVAAVAVLAVVHHVVGLLSQVTAAL